MDDNYSWYWYAFNHPYRSRLSICFRSLTSGNWRKWPVAILIPVILTDNACIESFHSLIKREWLNRFTIHNYQHAYSWSSNISKPFITRSVYTVIATTCHLMTTKNCIWGLRICQQLSWQNLSFYFVLNLDTEPYPSSKYLYIIITIFFEIKQFTFIYFNP